MALNLSLDLSTATLSDLEAFLAAARAAQAPGSAALSLEGNVVKVDVDKPRAVDSDSPRRPQAAGRERSLGDSTIRSIIEILSERLEPPYPPRGTSFGNFGGPHD